MQIFLYCSTAMVRATVRKKHVAEVVDTDLRGLCSESTEFSRPVCEIFRRRSVLTFRGKLCVFDASASKPSIKWHSVKICVKTSLKANIKTNKIIK